MPHKYRSKWFAELPAAPSRPVAVASCSCAKGGSNESCHNNNYDSNNCNNCNKCKCGPGPEWRRNTFETEVTIYIFILDAQRLLAPALRPWTASCIQLLCYHFFLRHALWVLTLWFYLLYLHFSSAYLLLLPPLYTLSLSLSCRPRNRPTSLNNCFTLKITSSGKRSLKMWSA